MKLLFGGLDTSQNPKILKVRVFGPSHNKIEIFQTKSDQNNSLELLDLLFKHIFHINDPTNDETSHKLFSRFPPLELSPHILQSGYENVSFGKTGASTLTSWWTWDDHGVFGSTSKETIGKPLKIIGNHRIIIVFLCFFLHFS